MVKLLKKGPLNDLNLAYVTILPKTKKLMRPPASRRTEPGIPAIPSILDQYTKQRIYHV